VIDEKNRPFPIDYGLIRGVREEICEDVIMEEPPAPPDASG